MTSGGRRGAITDLLTTSRHPFRSFDTLRDSAEYQKTDAVSYPLIGVDIEALPNRSIEVYKRGMVY